MYSLEAHMQNLDRAIEEYFRAQELKRQVGIKTDERYGNYKVGRFVLSRNGFGNGGYRVELDADDFKVLVYAGGTVYRPGPWQNVICEEIWKQTGRDLLAYRDACDRAQGALDDLLNRQQKFVDFFG